MVIRQTPPPLSGGHRAKRGIIALLGGVFAFLVFAVPVSAETVSHSLYPTAISTCSSGWSGTCNNILTTDSSFGVVSSAIIVADIFFGTNSINDLSTITKVTVTLVGNSSGNSGTGQIIGLRNGTTNCGATYPTKTLANGTTTLDISSANCTNFNSIATLDKFRDGSTYLQFLNSGSKSINLDAVYITLVGVGSYGVAESNYVCDYNALTCQSRFTGNTGYTSATAHCKIYFAEYCKNNDTGAEIENNTLFATVLLDAQNSTPSAYRIGSSTYIGADYSPTNSSWWVDLIKSNHSNATCNYPYTTQCYEVAADGTLTNFVLKTGDPKFKANPPILSSSDWTLDTSQQTSTASADFINDPQDGTFNPFKWLAESINWSLKKVFLAPALESLTGWEGFKTRLFSKFPFSIPYTIYSTSLSSIASTSAIPVTHLPFNIYGTNTTSDIQFTDTDDVVADTITSIKGVLTYVFYGLGFVYLWTFARRVSTPR